MSLDNLINSIKNNIPLEVANNVAKELASRTSTLLDAKRVEINRAFFDNEVEVDDNNDDTVVNTEEEFLHKIRNIEENTKLGFGDGTFLIITENSAKSFLSVYDSASNINRSRLLNIASKSKRGFTKVIQLAR